MKKIIPLVFAFVLSINALAFDEFNSSKTLNRSEALAEKALETHGGKKYKEMKTLVLSGDVDVTASVFNQAFPAKFLTIFSGDKYRLEIDNPFQPFKQVFDGEQTQTSVQRGFTFPPINRLGLPLLQRLGDEGFEVSALENKKKTGFRITSPEGYFTDFYLSKKTNRVKGYEASYVVNQRDVTTSVEIDKYEVKDGIVIPSKYAQRFDLGQMTVYAEFKTREIEINSEIDDEMFTLE